MNTYRSFFALTLGFCLPLIASAQIYKWVDENGKTHFSDQPAPDSAKAKMEQIEAAPDNVYSSNEALPADDKLRREQRRLVAEQERKEQMHRERRAELQAERDLLLQQHQKELEEAEALKKKRLAAVRGKNRRRSGE